MADVNEPAVPEKKQKPRVKGVVHDVLSPEEAAARAEAEVSGMSLKDMNFADIARTLTFGLVNLDGKTDEPEAAAKPLSPQEEAVKAARAAREAVVQKDDMQAQRELLQKFAQQDNKKPGREV